MHTPMGEAMFWICSQILTLLFVVWGALWRSCCQDPRLVHLLRHGLRLARVSVEEALQMVLKHWYGGLRDKTVVWKHPCAVSKIGVDNPCTQDKFDVLKTKGLHFMHLLNARSILPKWMRFDSWWTRPRWALYVFLKPGSIPVSISWLGLYFTVREDLVNDEPEILMIDLCFRKAKPILLGVCYRPPQQNSFYEHLVNVLNKYPKWIESECIVIGDCNTDVIKKACPSYSS